MPYPVVRLKGDKIFLKLGSEQCELDLGPDDMSGTAWNLMNTIHSRIQEVKRKRREATAAFIRQLDREAAEFRATTMDIDVLKEIEDIK